MPLPGYLLEDTSRIFPTESAHLPCLKRARRGFQGWGQVWELKCWGSVVAMTARGIKTRTPMGNSTFRDTLRHTKGIFCRARAFLTSAGLMIHVSGFVVLKYICGAQTPFC